MQTLALSLPSLIEKQQPIFPLEQGNFHHDLIFLGQNIISLGHAAVVTMDRETVAAILSHAFFGTLPNQNSEPHRILFHQLSFSLFFSQAHLQPLLCLLNYFCHVARATPQGMCFSGILPKSANIPTGNITIERKILKAPDWQQSTKPILPLLGIDIGRIEDTPADKAAHVCQPCASKICFYKL